MPCQAAGGIFLEQQQQKILNGQETVLLLLRFSSYKHTVGHSPSPLAEKEARPWLSALWLTQGLIQFLNGSANKAGRSPFQPPNYYFSCLMPPTRDLLVWTLAISTAPAFVGELRATD